MAKPLLPADALGVVKYRPAASPADTFNPYIARGAGGQLADLARGLSELSPALRQYAAVAGQREQQEAEVQANEYVARLSANQQQWNEAVASGKIAPAQSPWFRFYAARKMGQAQGERFTGALAAGLAELGPDASPEAFEQFVGQAREQFLAKSSGESANNAHFMEGFQATADATVSNVRRQFMAQQAQAAQARVGNDFISTASGMIRDLDQRGATVDQIAAALNGEAAAWAGVDPTVKRKTTLGQSQLNNGLAEAIRRYAKTEGKPELLKALAEKVDAGGVKLINASEFTDELAEDVAYAEAKREQRRAREAAAVKRQQSAVVEALTEQAATAWKERGPLDVAEMRRQLKAVGVEDVGVEIDKIKAKLLEDHPIYAAQFATQISQGSLPTEGSLYAAFNEGKINRADLDRLLGRVDAFQQRALARSEAAARRAEAGSLRRALTMNQAASNPLVSMAAEYVTAIIQSKTPKAVFAGDPRAVPPVDALQAQMIEAEARAAMMQWIMDNNGRDPNVYAKGTAFAKKHALAAARRIAGDKLVSANELVDGSPLAAFATPQAGPTKASAPAAAPRPMPRPLVDSLRIKAGRWDKNDLNAAREYGYTGGNPVEFLNRF
jgi:hypothetical protein